MADDASFDEAVEAEVNRRMDLALASQRDLPTIPADEPGTERVSLFDLLGVLLHAVDLGSTADEVKWQAVLGVLRADVVDEHLVIVRDNTDGTFTAYRENEPPPMPGEPAQPREPHERGTHA